MEYEHFSFVEAMVRREPELQQRIGNYSIDKVLGILFEDRIFRQQLARMLFGSGKGETGYRQVGQLVSRKISLITEELETERKLQTQMDSIQFRMNKRLNRFGH